MNGHEWEFFDCDSKAQCRRCGWVATSSVARTTVPRCMGGLTISGPATDSDVLESAVMKIQVRTGPYTQAELDRVADACKPDGDGWRRWRLDYEAPRGTVEVIDCFGKHHGPGPAHLYPFADTVTWYRVRDDLGVIGIDPASPDSADAFAMSVLGQMRPPKATDGSISTVPGKVGEVSFYDHMRFIEREIDKICGMPKALNVPRVERYESKDFGRYVVDTKTGRKYIAIDLYERIQKLADDVARDAGQRRERAEALLGDRAKDDKLLIDLLCDEIERLRGTDVAQLDQENARLRRELAEARQRLRGITFHGNDAGELVRIDERDSQGNVQRVMWEVKERRSDNVIRIEPFPEVKPYDGDWIPPSHKPRMLP